LKVHTHAISLTGTRRQRLDSRSQPTALAADGRQSARKRAGALDRAVDDGDHFFDVFPRAGAFFAQLSSHAAQHQSNTREVLAEPIVQVAADPLLLAIGDLDDLALEALALAEIVQLGTLLLLDVHAYADHAQCGTERIALDDPAPLEQPA